MRSRSRSRSRENCITDFKREAVKMANETDKTINQISRELGIGSNLIPRWKKELEEHGVAESFIDDKDAEIRRLRAELRDLKEDHEIVKKAAAYFAREKR